MARTSYLAKLKATEEARSHYFHSCVSVVLVWFGLVCVRVCVCVCAFVRVCVCVFLGESS